MPLDDLPSPTPGGIQVWQLTKFPVACPLGHVQLYVAAAAAAAGQALAISVGLAKILPHRPTAWVEMDSSALFHPKHSQRKSPMIDGTQPVYLASKGAISALPAPAQAPGNGHMQSQPHQSSCLPHMGESVHARSTPAKVPVAAWSPDHTMSGRLLSHKCLEHEITNCCCAPG